MPTNTSLPATEPHTNATVSASAGCGKTWLLVTRIIRLLLAGAEPGSILALTFTRKAAAEMSIRLNERLYEIAIVSEEDLIEALTAIGAEPDACTQSIARGLYEKCLHALSPVRVQTFHAFCQDILSKFPLEAEIPPGFELKEDTSLIKQQSWESLFAAATRDPEGLLADDLDKLMQVCNGPANTRTALNSLLEQRSDWLAYTQHQADPSAYATQQLRTQLSVDESTRPADDFCSIISDEILLEFATLLAKHKIKTNLQHADALSRLLSDKTGPDELFENIQSIFLTKDKKPRARKQSKSQEKSMGAVNETRFLELHNLVCHHLLEAIDLKKRCDALMLNKAWYRTGNIFIEIYQQLKQGLRVLDFADLEWKCYQLLKASDNALWIQFKIDQRIDHFLIDEFQDTNPTQWQLLKPLLEEIAANPDERWRSVFLVGDPKQSIYSFRRANPELQAEATQWLKECLDAQATPLDSSRRSSPAIIDVVNQIFSQDDVEVHFPDFIKHDTHLEHLPGSVTCLPLCTEDQSEENEIESIATPAALELRNPLLQPREDDQTDIRNIEAEQIARQIRRMMDSSFQITEGDATRTINYDDIMILMRNRTHSHVYEDVLRHHGIPFISNKRGSFLDNLEVNDLEKLLDSLITPFNNLAIAQVLKSPIFSASDDDLILLAQSDKTRSWYQRLSVIAKEQPENKLLVRADKKLRHWQELADTIPVHDLLDRIFSEGNILQRYSAAVGESKKTQVKANLQQFLELSLELNSGRYPSLSRFLDHLRNFKKQTAQAPDEPVVNTQSQCVRIMTIHASKGLESPVVFLADSNNTGSGKEAYSAMIYWPASNDKPTHFQLLTDKASMDSITASIQQKKAIAQAHEDLNLLYVATTRARQHLIISGTQQGRNKAPGWYPLIRSAMEALGTPGDDGVLHHDFGHSETTRTKPETTPVSNPVSIDPRLGKPVPPVQLKNRIIAPSQLDDETPHTHDMSQRNARERGIVIHRAIELLLNKATSTIENTCYQISREQSANSADEDLQSWVKEAYSIIHNPHFKEIFQIEDKYESHNELPLLFRSDGQSVYGIVDRLIIKDSEILLIDYKSHYCDEQSNLQQMAESFMAQLKLYKEGVSKIWPEHTIKTGILFTHCGELVWLRS